MDYPVIDFDPVMLDLGFFQIRWYAMAYITGMIGGAYWMIALASQPPSLVTRDEIWDLFTWVVLGVILGGRLGWAFFYDIDVPIEDARVLLAWIQGDQIVRTSDPGDTSVLPKVLRIWEGGMAFHGGLLGVVVAIILFARRRGLHPFAVSDLVACAVPIGLFFGRIANFINGELWGRPTDVSWAVIFPRADSIYGTGPTPRHPSQLYEGALEGFMIFVVLGWLARARGALYRPGLCTGLFLILYGLSRYVVEFARERGGDTDDFMPVWMSMGQLLSVPMVIAGLLFVAYAMRRPPTAVRIHDPAAA